MISTHNVVLYTMYVFILLKIKMGNFAFQFTPVNFVFETSSNHLARITLSHRPRKYTVQIASLLSARTVRVNLFLDLTWPTENLLAEKKYGLSPITSTDETPWGLLERIWDDNYGKNKT